MEVTEADATGAGVRAVAEMVEEARVAEMKAAVEKAAPAARVAMRRHPVASESKHCLNRQTAHQHAPLHCKSYVTQTGGTPLLRASTNTLVRSIRCSIATTKRSMDLGCMCSSVQRLGIRAGAFKQGTETDPAAEELVGGRSEWTPQVDE